MYDDWYCWIGNDYCCSLLNIPDEDRGVTPILLAVELGSMECIQELIVIGADLRSCDLQGNSVFHFAAKAEKPDALKVSILWIDMCNICSTVSKV